ncbi:MAG: hypothetical protein OER86_07290, partial [Phycisphaerae bacterium]|nr:hypothetical protein [Phycisphaerae bacterium]
MKRNPLVSCGRTALVVAINLLVAVDWSIAQPGPGDGPSSAATTGLPSAEQLEAKIKAIEGASDIDESLRKKLLDLYRTLPERMKLAAQYEQEAKQFERAIRDAPDEIARIRAQLGQAAPDPAKLSNIPPDATAAQVEQLETQQKQKLATATAARAELERQLAAMPSLAELSKSLDEATNKLADTERELAELSLNPPSGEPALLTEARRTTLQVRQYARQRQMLMLPQAQASHELRVQWLTAQRDELARQVAQVDAGLALIAERLSKARRMEVEAAR